MKKIKINWEAATAAFERNSPQSCSYIDQETGEVWLVSNVAALDDEVNQMIAANPERYIKIEPASSREQYGWMDRFVATVTEPKLKEKLLVAIDGKGAFRRFKDVLLSFPQERERWFNYRAVYLHSYINSWLKEKELETDPPTPWGEVELPAEMEDASRTAAISGPNPADTLRKQIKNIVEMLPAAELRTAQAFLEFLRDRSAAEMASENAQPDAPIAKPKWHEDDESHPDVDPEE